jgi:hypothetical protein
MSAEKEFFYNEKYVGKGEGETERKGEGIKLVMLVKGNLG